MHYLLRHSHNRKGAYAESLCNTYLRIGRQNDLLEQLVSSDNDELLEMFEDISAMPRHISAKRHVRHKLPCPPRGLCCFLTLLILLCRSKWTPLNGLAYSAASYGPATARLLVPADFVGLQLPAPIQGTPCYRLGKCIVRSTAYTAAVHPFSTSAKRDSRYVWWKGQDGAPASCGLTQYFVWAPQAQRLFAAVQPMLWHNIYATPAATMKSLYWQSNKLGPVEFVDAAQLCGPLICLDFGRKDATNLPLLFSTRYEYTVHTEAHEVAPNDRQFGEML